MWNTSRGMMRHNFGGFGDIDAGHPLMGPQPNGWLPDRPGRQLAPDVVGSFCETAGDLLSMVADASDVHDLVAFEPHLRRSLSAAELNATLEDPHRRAGYYGQVFNEIRPHEALGFKRPIEVYRDPQLRPIHDQNLTISVPQA
jgi:hypothetical protein